MNKCICDFCKEKEADRRHKVKRRYLKDAFDTKNYTEVDICDNCFVKLFRTKGEKNERIIQRQRMY